MQEEDKPKQKTRSVTVRMPIELYEKLERLAVAAGRMVTVSEVLRRLADKEPEPETRPTKKGRRNAPLTA